MSPPGGVEERDQGAVLELLGEHCGVSEGDQGIVKHNVENLRDGGELWPCR